MKIIITTLYIVGLVEGLLPVLNYFQSNCHTIEMNQLSIDKIHYLYRNDMLTPHQLTKCCLKRINQLNPSLNAIIEINPDAIKISKRLLKLTEMERVSKPLYGIPILISDDFGTLDEMETTAGSISLLGIKPKEEADIVMKLRKAGAIILGKTNLSEFSGLRFGFRNQGTSSRGGSIVNPFNVTHPVYGAGGGAAVAVATNMATLALSNSMSGSISGPVSAMGLFGFSPTKNYISTKGLVPGSTSVDNIGFITKNLQDIEKCIEIFAPEKFSKSKERYHLNHPSYSDINLEGLNIGILEHLNPDYSNDRESFESINFLQEKFEKDNINFNFNFKPVYFPYNETVFTKSLRGLMYEYETSMDLYLTHNVTRTRKAHYVYSSYTVASHLKLKNLKPFFLEEFIFFIYSTPTEKRDQYDAFLSLQETYQFYFNHYAHHDKIQVFITTSQPEIATSAIPTLLGYPTITIPIGSSSSSLRNFGLTLSALPGNDALLLNLASKIDRIIRAKEDDNHHHIVVDQI